MKTTDLSTFDNSDYNPGAGLPERVLWYFVNACFFTSRWLPISRFKVFLLKLFGAKIGKGVVIKPAVNIKYPWHLTIGNHVWIGENVWIDNLDKVSIGSHTTLSQGVMLLCGNHNYKSPSFDLITGAITLEDGVWIGAKSLVGPGVICRSHALLSVQSVATSDLEAYKIYRGNPAVFVKNREIS
ncbi:MAG: WcaF family extracellular polysaccharide biosynthesis acetyltransferase [Bacteroidota bacterium]|nr:WcaF family extracellular polysaccharide biosynthesis acetyltransferase [Bacteroidota bacterium]